MTAARGCSRAVVNWSLFKGSQCYNHCGPFYFMQARRLTLVVPRPQKGISCVYKITFDTGRFYIGSTKDLQKRIDRHRDSLRHDRKTRSGSSNLKKEAAISHSATFEIVERCGEERLYREDFYIKQNIGNPLFLNMSSSAFKCEGVRRTKEEKDQARRRALKNDFGRFSDRFKKKVGRINSYGQVIIEYDSIASAAKHMNMQVMNFKVAMREGHKIRGFIFRILDNSGLPIHPTEKVKKKKGPKKGGWKTGLVSHNARAVVRVGVDGEVTESY